MPITGYTSNMALREDLLRNVIKGPEAWLKYVSSLRLSELRKIESQLTQILAEHEQLLGELRNSATVVESQIKKQEQVQENRRRTSRSDRIGVSLREFLCQSPLEVDASLDKLTLCTKTGASVLLDGLVFKIEGKEQTARTVNQAKTFHLIDQDPWAGHHLHYAREGHVSAGFAWDRPFLDEIFLLRTFTK